MKETRRRDSQHVPNALLDEAHLHIGLNGNLGDMPEAINVRQDLQEATSDASTMFTRNPRNRVGYSHVSF